MKNKEQGEDLSGHGTHVAGSIYMYASCFMLSMSSPYLQGIIMSETYGIANEATAIAVRVLDKNEITTTM